MCAANLPPNTFGKGEIELVQAFLQSLEKIEQQELENDWAEPQSVTFPALSGKPSQPGLVKKIWLALSVALLVQAYKAGAALTDANPQWPDAPQPCALFFAEKATEGIHKAILSAQKFSAEENVQLLRNSLGTLAKNHSLMVA